VYLHGKRDTYNLRLANEFNWETKGKTLKDGVNCDYKGIYEFWEGLVALRKSSFGEVFRIDGKTPENYFRWIEPENSKLLGYLVNEKVLVLLNTDEKDGEFKNVVFPEGEWILTATNEQVNLKGVQGESSKIKGKTKLDLKLKAENLKIWVKK
ncbi:pullulanase, partial [bacterium]|nr:pullulanase [bacterium]